MEHRKNITSLIVLVVSLLMISTAEVTEAHIRSISLMLYRCQLEETEHKVDPGEGGYRIPVAPVVCAISSEEMSIEGIDTNSILKYEVYDETPDLIMSFLSQKDFIDFVFCSSGPLIIRLVFEDYALIGYLDRE